jgi:hypothetical protein
MYDTNHFEVGHVYMTKAEEIWYVTKVDKHQGRVDFLILYAKVKSIIGVLSWFFPYSNGKINFDINYNFKKLT